jgi:hypothetical protein
MVDTPTVERATAPTEAAATFSPQEMEMDAMEALRTFLWGIVCNAVFYLSEHRDLQPLCVARSVNSIFGPRAIMIATGVGDQDGDGEITGRQVRAIVRTAKHG